VSRVDAGHKMTGVVDRHASTELMMATVDHPLSPFVDPLPIPPRRVITEPARLTIRVQTALHRFHRELPPSRVWAYDGHLPGPTIEVRRGVPLEVVWENRIEGMLPMTVTIAPDYAVDGIPVQCLPGRSGGEPDPSAAALSGFSAVHLHGAVTHASSDGWAENLAAPGQQALDVYPNDQRAAMLWYHDHVMGVTRFHVYAGLAGLWIVRDDRERELELPEDPPYELPLLLTDRNFDVSTSGLTGELLHKTDPEVRECFGPFTAVKRQGVAANRRRADHLPVPHAERLERSHVPTRALTRWSTRPRAGQADRCRRGLAAGTRIASPSGTHAGIG
jgi:hypothetical protein